ncbi:MAG TPA: AAA domain-containing protein [Ohtaekwangia sp.]|uniref:AAA domain-containing protein n=1 Tax=Ohtaekwangia sp. TaxID=2066019 RepID=UPI002F949728
MVESSMSANTKYILQTYLRRLTNLSGNSRSLLLLRLSAEQLMDVHSLSFLNNERSFEIINALIAGRNKKLCQVLDSRMEANNEASKKLKNLQRIDRFIYEERGSNDLHVGWPFIHGKFSDGTAVRCPLLYFPVSIVQAGQHWVLEPREDAGITFNKSFLLAYALYNKVKLDETLSDISFDDFDTDSTVFRTQLYQLIKDKIELNFNPDNFRDELIPFQPFKKDEFSETHKNGELKLYPEAVLGIFPQAGSQLVPDYQYLLENDFILDLEDFFTGKSAPIAEARISEEKIFTPFLLDAHQERAIKAVKMGKSVVVQGPPGTGKSQLICNLLADAMASGKKALLVCQKRAALDVVYNRLKEIDLGDFLGLIHDFRNDRKEIFAKIARQIEGIDAFKTRNRSVDVIQTERRFFQMARRIDAITEELEEFRNALFSEQECGLAVKELYLTSDPYAPSINIKQEYHYFSFSEIDEFTRTLKMYTNYAAWFEGDDYLWRDRRSFADFHHADEKEIEKTIRDLVHYQKHVASEIYQLTGATLNLEDAESFFFREDDILGMISVLKDEQTYQYFQRMMLETDDETSLLWLANMERVVLNCFQEDGPETTILSDQLGKVQEALQQRVDARSNLIRMARWEFFSENKFLVKRVLVANGLAYNKIGLNVLEQRIDSRLNLEHHLTALRQKVWLQEVPGDYSSDNLKKWFRRKKFAVRAKLIFNSLREVCDAVNVQQLARQEFIGLMHQLIQVVREIPAKKAAWLNHLSPYQYRQLVVDPSLETEFIKVLKRDFDNLCAFDKLKSGLKFYEKEVIVKLNDHLKEWDAAAMESLFQNSVRLAWIDHIETKYPVLRSVSSMKMDSLEAELQQAVAEKQKLSEEILLVRAREHVYEGIEYNRLNNRVTYRDLLHQVTKKKKIWPVRKVITEFQEELFRLVPCWMASPESVSAIFPMMELFDIVIFDEASQCFAERGIPSMYRGKQVVVAGDIKQLRPNEMYQVRWEDDQENPDLEVDSVLELVERYVSTVHLQGHYRSRSLELIDFSNRHFYEGRLQLLPDRNTLNKNQPAIEYKKVDGMWEGQTNIVEAEAVVTAVMNLLRDYPNKEIGVVTFNAPQQLLILDLLEAEAMRAQMALPATLFVKNIENVQGDEKDFIIFSIGYAPDKNGKMMMQFGSLNTTGGENRLNVAITRARERVILVSSIWPEQLKTEEVKNDGPRLLKQYLAFAREVDQRRFTPQTVNRDNERATWHLKKSLQRWSASRLQGFTFETNELPFTDITVKKQNQYVGVLLTDDTRYYQSESVKEAHAYTPALLAQKNWQYRVVHSRNFWRDREKVEHELILFAGTANS